MPTFDLFWAPEGKQIAWNVVASDASEARRQAPKPYRKYLGEIAVKEITCRSVVRVYEIKWYRSGECHVYAITNGAWVDSWSHGAWLDTGRLPDDIRTVAEGMKPAGEER